MLVFFSYGSIYAYAIDKEEISQFYQKVIPERKTVSVSVFKEVQEVDYLLVATENVKEGVYEVSVTRVGDHIYMIDDTDIYIEMPYCYEYSFRDNAILEVFSYMGYTCGNLIFTKN